MVITENLGTRQKRQAEIFERLGYKPSEEQLEIHLDDHWLRLVAGGERGGKSLLAGYEIGSRFWEGDLFWLVGADYERTKAEYDYCVEAFEKLGVLVSATKQVNPGLIVLYGGIEISTKSARDPRKLGMKAPRGIVVCEAAQIDYDTYERLVGRLAEKRGWMLLTGTFEGSLGWYPELHTRWQVENNEGGRGFSLPTWSNKAIFPDGRNDEMILTIERAMSPERFQERFAGVPCPPSGRVFNEFMVARHVRPIEFNPDLDVYLWIDPGYAGAYAVEAVQFIGDQVFVFDEIYQRSLVTSQMIQIAKTRSWWQKVAVGVVDISAKQHQALPAVTEIWQKEAGLFLRSNPVRINEGIERLKTFLLPHPVTGEPNLYVDSKCKGLISELGGCPNPFTGQTAVYRWKVAREGFVVGDTPEDRNNHAIKATIYGLVEKFGFSPSAARGIGWNYLKEGL